MARHLFAHSFIHYLLNVYHVLGAVLNFIIVLYLVQHLDTWYTFNKIFLKPSKA